MSVNPAENCILRNYKINKTSGESLAKRYDKKKEKRKKG